MKHLLKFGTTAACLIGRGFSVLLFVAIAVGTVSCIADDNPQVKEDMADAIGFGISGEVTRAVPMSELKKIGVFGYSHLNSYTADIATSKPEYFLNKPVIDPAGNGNWTYDGPTKYWPMTGVKLSFFAYAPFIDVEDTFVLTPTSVAGATGAPAITYTVPSGIADQTDLVWGNALDQMYDTNGGVVDFDMDHALTMIGFQLKLHSDEENRPFVVEIKELTVQNVIGSGTLDLSKELTDVDLWDTPVPLTDADLSKYTMTPAAGLTSQAFDARVTSPAAGEFNPFTFNSILDGGNYLMLIPQNIDGTVTGLTPAQVVIKYTYTNVYASESFDGEQTLALSTATLKDWTPGDGINYRLTLSLVSGKVIDFDIEGMIVNNPWEDVNGGTPIEADVN